MAKQVRVCTQQSNKIGDLNHSFENIPVKQINSRKHWMKFLSPSQQDANTFRSFDLHLWRFISYFLRGLIECLSKDRMSARISKFQRWTTPILPSFVSIEWDFRLSSKQKKMMFLFFLWIQLKFWGPHTFGVHVNASFIHLFV